MMECNKLHRWDSSMILSVKMLGNKLDSELPVVKLQFRLFLTLAMRWFSTAINFRFLKTHVLEQIFAGSSLAKGMTG